MLRREQCSVTPRVEYPISKEELRERLMYVGYYTCGIKGYNQLIVDIDGIYKLYVDKYKCKKELTEVVEEWDKIILLKRGSSSSFNNYPHGEVEGIKEEERLILDVFESYGSCINKINNIKEGGLSCLKEIFCGEYCAFHLDNTSLLWLTSGEVLLLLYLSDEAHTITSLPV